MHPQRPQRSRAPQEPQAVRQGARSGERLGDRHGRAGRAPTAVGRFTRPAAAGTAPERPEPAETAAPRGVAGGRGRNRLTGRATALFVVLAMLAVAYAWPVKEYLRQRSELARLRADTAQTQARVDVLQALKQRWADPAYVQTQARERLHFVLPGETAYVVLQPDHPAAVATLPKQTAPVLQPWYDQLWDSVQGADAPSRH